MWEMTAAQVRKVPETKLHENVFIQSGFSTKTSKLVLYIQSELEHDWWLTWRSSEHLSQCVFVCNIDLYTVDVA